MASGDRLTITGDLDVFSVHRQWDAAVALIHASVGDLEVDLSAVGDLDASGIQLLMGLRKTLRTRGAAVSFHGVPQDWVPRLAQLGIDLSNAEGAEP